MRWDFSSLISPFSCRPDGFRHRRFPGEDSFRANKVRTVIAIAQFLVIGNAFGTWRHIPAIVPVQSHRTMPARAGNSNFTMDLLG